jgi:two-component system cell cycle sensor histidine kinase/response regulator CckA
VEVYNIVNDKEEYIQQKLLGITPSLGGHLLFYGAATFLLLGILDFFVTPENFKLFLLYRAAASSFLFLLSYVLKLNQNKLFHTTVIIAGVFATAAALELMILSFGGHQSTYYAGMIIALIFIFGFVPISPKATLLLAFSAYAIYLLPILFLDKITNVGVFINNNTFLLSAIIIGLAWRYVNYNLLVKNLSLQYDLEQQKKELESYSTQLEELVRERTKKLNESELWHRSLFDNATDGIVVLGRDGTILNINERAADMHGFAADSLLGANIKLLESDQDAAAVADRLGKVMAGESIVYETTHKRRDGAPLHLEISSKAIMIGDVLYIQSFYRDITEKKRIQAHLMQAQKMESLGALVGGIAHDFNNVLTAIVGHATVAGFEPNLSDKAKRSLQTIQDAGHKAAGVISKLLGFARKSEYAMLPLNVNDVIYDTVKLLEHSLGSVSLQIELDSKLPVISGDVNQLNQVVMNLLVNARDAMPRGGRITISTSRTVVAKDSPNVPPYVVPGDYVEVRIADTGVGIPDEVIQKIFEPFYTTKERGKGTGLGLSMVYGTIKEHQGYIVVLSSVGVGSTFVLYLPVPQHQVPAVVKTAQSLPRGTERVLLVDDEEDVLSAVRELLSSNGYTVTATHDPQQALALFQQMPAEYDLVITDMVMPGLPGPELIKRIRALNTGVGILAISGYANYVAGKDEIREVAGFLQKPFNAMNLLTMVRKIIDAKRDEAGAKPV